MGKWIKTLRFVLQYFGISLDVLGEVNRFLVALKPYPSQGKYLLLLSH